MDMVEFTGRSSKAQRMWTSSGILRDLEKTRETETARNSARKQDRLCFPDLAVVKKIEILVFSLCCKFNYALPSNQKGVALLHMRRFVQTRFSRLNGALWREIAGDLNSLPENLRSLIDFSSLPLPLSLSLS